MQKNIIVNINNPICPTCGSTTNVGGAYGKGTDFRCLVEKEHIYIITFTDDQIDVEVLSFSYNEFNYRIEHRLNNSRLSIDSDYILIYDNNFNSYILPFTFNNSLENLVKEINKILLIS